MILKEKILNKTETKQDTYTQKKKKHLEILIRMWNKVLKNLTFMKHIVD